MNTWRTVAGAVKGRWIALGVLAVASFAGGMAEAGFLLVATQVAFATAEGRDEVDFTLIGTIPVSAALAVAGSLLICRLGVAVGASRLAALIHADIIRRSRMRLADAFLSASWEVQQRQRHGSLQELMTSFAGRPGAVATAVNGVVLSFTSLTAMLILALWLNPLGALGLVLAVGGIGMVLRPLRSAVRRRSRAADGAGMDLAMSLAEVSNLGLELHVFHVQDEAKSRVRRFVDRSYERGLRRDFAASLSAPAYTFAAYAALLGALAFISVIEPTDLGSLGAVMLIMIRSLNYGQGLQSAYMAVLQNVPGVEEFERQVEQLVEGHREDRGLPVDEVGLVEFEDVYFSYLEGQPVLRDVSFSIPRREIVGIVGPSGSGKSTLVQLLLGVRDPESGRVLSGGRDIAEFGRADWARRVAFVPQESQLISGTIRENIRFLRPHVSDEAVENAAKLAHLHEEIVRFPDGYDREIGSGGAHLSGGQQQRLCIARALVVQPDVIILDEPTSALDVRSEDLVRKSLFDLKNETTVIIIAHRLSTLDICDRIMVIQDGEIRGFDTPSRLERDSEFYREALVLSGLR
jgi:ATP-binding cassette, subfamily B, bacterial